MANDPAPPAASALLGDTSATITPPVETSAARAHATAEIARLKSDPAFAQRLLRGEGDALNIVAQLSRTLNSPTQVVIGGEPNPAEIQQRLNAWTDFADLTPEVTEQLKNGQPVTKQEYDMARQTKARLMSDKAWCARYLDGGRVERQQMSLVSIILSSQMRSRRNDPAAGILRADRRAGQNRTGGACEHNPRDYQRADSIAPPGGANYNAGFPEPAQSGTAAMSDALDAFMAEVRAVCGGDFPEAARMEAAFHDLQTATGPMMIEMHDRMAEIIRRPLPLLQRMEKLKALMDEPAAQ
jgi:hypothetical protein